MLCFFMNMFCKQPGIIHLVKCDQIPSGFLYVNTSASIFTHFYQEYKSDLQIQSTPTVVMIIMYKTAFHLVDLVFHTLNTCVE